MENIDREKLEQESQYSSEELLENKLKEKKVEFKRPNILISGYTGAGKTTLLQKIFGKELVPDSMIGHFEPRTAGFDKYENAMLKIYDSAGLVLGQTEENFLNTAKEFVEGKQEDPNVDNHIHLVWYCISLPGARVEECDLSLIKNIFPNVIVVGTKNDIAKPNQRDGILQKLKANGVKEGRIIYTSEEDNDSIMRLIDLSYELLPSAYKDAFISAQKLSIKKKREKCELIIHGAAGSAAAVGAIPIPMSDAAIITPIQTGMIVGMGMIMGIPEGMAKKIFLPVVARTIGIMTASSLIKLFPVIGSAIQAGIAAALTEAVGWISLNYFEQCAIASIEDRPMPDFVFNQQEFKTIFEEMKQK